MAFNKNRKRAIGIIASYLFGLSSSSGVFEEHSYFEPKMIGILADGLRNAKTVGKMNGTINLHKINFMKLN